MTDELQRPAGGLSEPTAFTGSIESLGFTSGALSTPTVVIPEAEIVLTSRRALRDATSGASRPLRGTAAHSHATDGGSSRRATRRRAHRTVVRADPAANGPSEATRVPMLHRMARRALPPTVMLAVAALLIGTTVPVNAFLRSSDVGEASPTASAPQTSEPTQVLDLSGNDAATALSVSRDDWTVTSYEENLKAKYGNRSLNYASTGTGAVRWPFPYFAQISSPFGARTAPCRGCSSFHQGIDMLGGDGMPVYAIADGVVSSLQEDWSYGEHVFIEHEVNGQRVTSLYAHMGAGSTMVAPGQEVKAGDPIGLVGNTGASTGPHTHLEIRLDGLKVDPYAWLTANAS